MRTCHTCNQPWPEEEIRFVFPDNKTRQNTVELLEQLANDCQAGDFYKTILETTLTVSQAQLAVLAELFHKAAGHKDPYGQPFNCVGCEDLKEQKEARDAHVHNYQYYIPYYTPIGELGYKTFCSICGERPEEGDAR